MGYKVILAEKSSVAASIAKIVGADESHKEKWTGYYEGNGYKVTWAMGHIITNKSPEEMGFPGAVLPIFPENWETKIIQEQGKGTPDPYKEKQLKIIEKLFKGCDSIIEATDAGREGELIFRLIYEYLDCKKPVYRLWISSLTDEAIRKGMQDLKPGQDYNALSEAAHARSHADWLVGFNCSRALRIATGLRTNVSLGRVQTPTLGMICERYLANKNFKPTYYWQLRAETAKNDKPFICEGEKKHDCAESADTDLRRAQSAGNLTVTKIEKKHSSIKPPLLFDLTSLQRAANNKYGLTAKETLDVAQKLYENKLLSYPRTSSCYIPEDVFRTIPDLLKKLSNHDRWGELAARMASEKLCNKSVNDAKVTDHHALLPTGVSGESLEGAYRKIYDLVVGRMLEAFGQNSEADNTTVTLSANNIIFKAHGSTPTFLGWKEVYGVSAEKTKNDNGEDDDESSNEQLPNLKEGDILPINKIESVKKSDKPLPIFTDSSLLGEMETCGKKIEDEELRESMKDVGLGTPATRAQEIEGLIAKHYIRREGKKLMPEEFGLKIWDIVKGRKIADVKTTGEWERDLGLMEKGKYNPDTFDKAIKAFCIDTINDLKTNCKPIEGLSTNGEPLRKCFLCGQTMKNDKFSIHCECGLKIHREIGGKKLSGEAITQLCNGKTTALIKGFTSKAGKKFDARLSINKDTKMAQYVFEEKNINKDIKPDGHICPCCGKEMTFNGWAFNCGCGFKMNITICGVTLTMEQIYTLLKGEKIAVKGFTSKAGKKFDATLFINTEKKKADFEFNNKK